MDNEILTLTAASEYAEVTLATMRSYAKQIPGAKQLPTKEWQIPLHDLRVFLVEKEEKAKGKGKGKGRSGASANASGNARANATGNTPVNKLEALMEARIRDLETELSKRDRTIERLQTDLKEAQGEVMRLNAEMIAHLSGGSSLVGSVSRWIKTKTR